MFVPTGDPGAAQVPGSFGIDAGEARSDLMLHDPHFHDLPKLVWRLSMRRATADDDFGFLWNEGTSIAFDRSGGFHLMPRKLPWNPGVGTAGHLPRRGAVSKTVVWRIG